jgi:RimJ/RimL family protein N-acetyltransferase
MASKRVVAPSLGIELMSLPRSDLADEIHVLAAEPEVSRYMEWEKHACREDTECFLSWCAAEARSHNGYHFAVRHAGAVVGVTSVTNLNLHHGIGESTTWLGKPFWGCGLRLQAVRVLFAWAFEILGLHKLVFRVAANNERSIASHARLHTVVEGRLREEMRLADGPVDVLYYGLLRADYRQFYPRVELDIE